MTVDRNPHNSGVQFGVSVHAPGHRLAGRISSHTSPARGAAAGRTNHCVPEYPLSGVFRPTFTGAVTAVAPDAGTLARKTRVSSSTGSNRTKTLVRPGRPGAAAGGCGQRE